MDKLRPKVGIGVYILNPQNQVLLLYESRADSGKTWSAPGGHLDFGEELLDCAKRETREEVNLEILEADLWSMNNNVLQPNVHYVNFDFLVKSYKGTPKIMEPEKCLKMEWFNLNNLPEPLLLASKNFFGRNPLCLCRSGKKLSECHGKK